MQELQVTTTSLEGVRVIVPPTNFEDFRGSYVELYNKELFHRAGITQEFIQDDISTSTKHVLRGIHGDEETWKLVACLHGSFYLVIVNQDESSDQFGKWESITLSDTNRLQVLIPPKFGNGHVVLSDTAIFHYKQTTTYNRASQFTIVWNDPKFDFWWPVKSPILSQRDSGL